MSNPMLYHSQAKQDEFVDALLHGKKGGFWLELGGNDAVEISNTYYLEKQLGWSGVTVEMEQRYAQSYVDKGRNATKLVIADATRVDYPKVLREAGAPETVIDYLQVDLEPGNGSTLAALELLNRDVLPHWKVSVITFEHDYYCTGDANPLRKRSREIFASHGYVRLFDDVCCHNYIFPFEDWYAHPTVVSAAGLAAMREELRVSPPNPKGILPDRCIALTRKHFA